MLEVVGIEYIIDFKDIYDLVYVNIVYFNKIKKFRKKYLVIVYGYLIV